MLLIVDGTGPISNRTYEREMWRSFCSRLRDQLGIGASYHRGPSADGFLTIVTAERVSREIRRLPPSEKVYLCGYSRGGAAVIAAAQRADRQIEALFLFDAVDREAFLSTDVIPLNVGQTYHALRDPKFNMKYETAVDLAQKHLGHQLTHYSQTVGLPTFRAGVELAERKLNELDFKFGRTRTWFGNTGTKACRQDTYRSHLFAGTHGALGGVPWLDVPGDEHCRTRVANWMTRNFARHGFNVRL